ncbi:unnamed protein product [Brassica napus]|uniref:(rape) hypothetical protein n=1 Tax=Brassica napus TaxID=3708 RepID=A0A816KMZ0_BRANA|nr:unnamed protein product [Brassica napus]
MRALQPRTREPIINTSYLTQEEATVTRAPPPEHNRPPLKSDLAGSEPCLKVNPRRNYQAPLSQTHLTTAPKP